VIGILWWQHYRSSDQQPWHTCQPTSEADGPGNFFIARGAGMPEVLAWVMAMESGQASVAEAQEVVAAMDDVAVLAIAASLPDDEEGRASFWGFRESGPFGLGRTH
jgi:hypothetical protein